MSLDVFCEAAAGIGYVAIRHWNRGDREKI